MLDDLLLAADSGQSSSILIILDFTTAFETIDNFILIELLKKWVGISRTVLEKDF